jgi:Zn-dependent alcohol dehydrogenase
MVATGVCRTALSIFQGHLSVHFPIVLGHGGPRKWLMRLDGA